MALGWGRKMNNQQFLTITNLQYQNHALKMKLAASQAKLTLLGPSSAGILSVGEIVVGTMPTPLFEKGKIVSGTETLEGGQLNDWTALVQSSTFDKDGKVSYSVQLIKDFAERNTKNNK